ncbi:MAG: hypothetical protein HXX15_10860 [Rhodopseudomonas sp.]|uniref:hypothetical protein n=1 Tax=Rhodopseudomonas sp. TaxID=1078 RepID=UPI0017B51BFF|nr:hypothetical protein [Rhodopseudomonas sp.]NVN86575.1 hypothetical protein [Rhodopseudomonas sp.]
MQMRITDDSETIDRATSRSICGAIGERLRLNMRPDGSELPSALRNLLDEMRRREGQSLHEPDRQN